MHARTHAHRHTVIQIFFSFPRKELQYISDLFVKTVAPVCSIYCLRMKYSKDKNPRQHESQPRTPDWNRCISVAHSSGKQFASATFSIPLLTPTNSPTGIPQRDYLHRPWQKYNFIPSSSLSLPPEESREEEGRGRG